MRQYSWGDLIHLFIRHCRNTRGLSENTISAYVQDLDAFATHAAAHDIALPLIPENITDFVQHLREVRGHAPATVRRRIACLRVFCRWLEKDGHSAASPFRDIDLQLKIPRRLPRAIGRDHLHRIARATAPARRPDRVRLENASIDPTTALVIALLVATGIRVGEMAAIRRADMAPDGSSIRIHGKGSRERTVYIGNAGLAGRLCHYRDDRAGGPGDRLFVNRNGHPLTPQAFRLRLKRLSKELGIEPPLTPHRFRHTAATTLIEEGVDIRFVQRLLGHSSIATTEIYTHVTDRSLRAAIEGADALGRLGF